MIRQRGYGLGHCEAGASGFPTWRQHVARARALGHQRPFTPRGAGPFTPPEGSAERSEALGAPASDRGHKLSPTATQPRGPFVSWSSECRGSGSLSG